MVDMNNNLLPIGYTRKGMGHNMSKITDLARGGFEIPVSLPRALITMLLPYKIVLGLRGKGLVAGKLQGLPL